MTDVWRLVEVERLAIADFLETLGPDEWRVQSLCDAWTVQECAAHVAWGNTVPVHVTLAAVARAGFRANRANADLARKWGANPPATITARLREVAVNRRLTPGTKPVDALADVLCHDLDIRRPLGRERRLPDEAFRMAADRFTRVGWPISMAYGRNPKAMATGIRLVADDVDWHHGDGPEVRGSASAVLRAITGRPVDAGELTGPGIEAFRARLS